MADNADKKAEAEERELHPALVVGGVIGIFAALWVFLVGLGLMGDAFKCLGGRGAGNMFGSVNNPIAGLMVGILATVLVQSSSTSTSIVVGLVGADQITVKNGIPIIMGANIGTSVTNTIVSMGHVGNRIDLERAFSGATVHDMFNMLTVCTLLPIEIIIGAISGEGGLLYWVTKGITEGLVGGEKSGELFPSPIKAVTKPVTKAIISNNKYIINALALEEPKAQASGYVLNATGEDETTCVQDSSRRLQAKSQWDGWHFTGEELPSADDAEERSLLAKRRLSSSFDCTEYYCVVPDLDKNFKKISKKAYKKKLHKCTDYGLPDDLCSGKEKCYLDGGAYYQKYVLDGHIIKGGMVEGAGDNGGGFIALILSLVLLCLGLFALVKLLSLLLIKKAKRVIAKATSLNDYLAILVGLGITIIVQSSSVTTSALTPLCGIGILPLEKMLPMTLGANLGTTLTALIAAMVSMKFKALQIALCHLTFNILGCLIWFPAPPMRQIPLNAARLLGLYASYYRGVPGLYILFAFVFVPGILLGLSALYDVSVAGGVILTLFFISIVVAFEFWWIKMGGCYKVLSQEQRQARIEELKKSNSQMRGEDGEEAANAASAATV